MPDRTLHHRQKILSDACSKDRCDRRSAFDHADFHHETASRSSAENLNYDSGRGVRRWAIQVRHRAELDTLQECVHGPLLLINASCNDNSARFRGRLEGNAPGKGIGDV